MSLTDPASAPDGLVSLNSNTELIRVLRMVGPRVTAVAVAGVLGFLVDGRYGLAFGAIAGLAYILGAGIAAGHYAMDLHEARVLDTGRAPATNQLTESMAGDLGIEPPSVYRIEVERPQICVTAVGFGRQVQGKIGVSYELLQKADDEQLPQLIALAMARIWSGEATIMSSAATIAGFPLQLARSHLVNGSADWKIHDLECGMSPIGKFILIVSAPFSRQILRLAGAAVSVLRSDRAALRLRHGRFAAPDLENAIRWLHHQQSPVVRDPINEYNPAEVVLFLVSPFEVDFEQPGATTELPLWRRARFLVTSVVPHLELRLQLLRDRVAELGPEILRPAPEPIDPFGRNIEL